MHIHKSLRVRKADTPSAQVRFGGSFKVAAFSTGGGMVGPADLHQLNYFNVLGNGLGKNLRMKTHRVA